MILDHDRRTRLRWPEILDSPRRVAWCDEITRRNFKTKIQVDGGVASEDRAWS